MRFKWLKAFFLSCSLATLPNFANALTIGPIEPLAIDDTVTPRTVFIASSNGVGGLGIDEQTGYGTRKFVLDNYPLIDLTTVSGSQVTIRFSQFASDTPFINLYVLSTQTTDDTLRFVYPLETFSAAGASSQASNYFEINANTVQVDLSFSLKQLCEIAQPVEGLCASNSVSVPTTTAPTGVILVAIPQATAGVAVSDDDVRRAANRIRIIPQVEGPDVSSGCPSAGSYGETVFYPGDGAITFHTSSFRARTPTRGGSRKFLHFRVIANSPSLPTSLRDAQIFALAPYNSGDQVIEGFQNSTAETQTAYEALLGVSDTSGSVSYCTNAYSGIFASDIQGFLKDSNCFIATATYENSRHPVVLILREFRDQILNSSSVGRFFVQTYYEYSPSAAEFLIRNEWLRPLVKRVLLPITVFAWVLLHPGWMILAIVAFALVIAWARRKTAIAMLAVALLMTSASVQASDQPYIDSLLSDLPPRAEASGSYTEELKKKLPAQESGSYTEELRKDLGEQKTADGYTDELKKTVGEKKGGNSAIADFQSNKKLVMNRGDMRIKTALSLKIATAMNREYNAGESQERPFKTIYGEGWQPDIQLTYEYRPFYVHSLLSGIGFLGGVGFTSVRGKGQFAYVSNFGNESNIRFNFMSAPVYVGPVLRLYLVDWFVPFFGAGAGALGFYETRSDRKPSARGYSWMYWMNGGVNIGLDWMSQRSTWERFDDNAIKHLYLTVEYQRFQTISGLVDASISGVNAGFLYEF